MLGISDKSALVAFCERVSKLENVYVIADRGKNAARARQVWRIDDPENCFDTGELFRDIESRLISDPSEENTFIRAMRLQTGDRLDTVKIGPLEEPETNSLESASAVGHLSVALSGISRELVLSTERQLHESRAEIRELREENKELRDAVVQYAILERVGMRTDQLEAEGQPSEMSEAWAFLHPLLTQVASRLLLTGPQEGQEGQPEPQDVEIDCSGWVDRDADAVVTVLVAMSRQRPDLVTGARIERLMASPLGKLVANHLMGAK